MFTYFWIGSRLLTFIFSSQWTREEWAVILFSLPILTYHLLFEIMMNGQSLGKKAMSIKVITIDGGQPSISQYLIRWIFRLADFPLWIFAAIIQNALPWWCSPLLFAGIGCVIITEKSQRIGDLVADHYY
jgi:uncharacterized RDD family membrane protein YckC